MWVKRQTSKKTTGLTADKKLIGLHGNVCKACALIHIQCLLFVTSEGIARRLRHQTLRSSALWCFSFSCHLENDAFSWIYHTYYTWYALRFFNLSVHNSEFSVKYPGTPRAKLRVEASRLYDNHEFYLSNNHFLSKNQRATWFAFCPQYHDLWQGWSHYSRCNVFCGWTPIARGVEPVINLGSFVPGTVLATANMATI